MNLNLVPGTAISEKEISLRYQVSRTPVRETFIHLAKEGLVRVIPQKETVVSLIDFARVEQESFLRKSLEMAVLEPFIKQCSSACFSDLEQLISLQIAAFDQDEYINFVNYDNAFHRTFFEIAGQELSWEVLENMSGHYHRVRLLTIQLNGIAEDIVEQHQKLIDVLKQKDLDKAAAVLTQHLQKLNTEETLLKEAFPHYFLPREKKDVFDIDFGDLILPKKQRPPAESIS
jgi:DNA-binding GntR family transcriptional regulator